MSTPVNLTNSMGGNGGVAFHTTSATAVTPSSSPNSFSSIKALNTTLVITAITSAIDFSSVLPIYLDRGDVLLAPGCTSVTVTGDGVAYNT